MASASAAGLTRCVNCGRTSSIEYDGQIGGHVCVECGTLVDASQFSVSAEHDWGMTQAAGGRQTFSRPIGDIAPDVLRIRGRIVGGQSGTKEAYQRGRKADIQAFIEARVRVLGHPGLAPRALHLFDIGFTTMGARWGKAAVRIAAAAVLLALREEKKGLPVVLVADSFRVEPMTIVRSYLRLKQVTGVEVDDGDPIIYIGRYCTFFQSLQPPPNLPGRAKSLPFASSSASMPSSFSPEMRAYLIQLNMRAVRDLAFQIARLVTEEISLPSPPTLALCIVMLAMEGSLKRKLPSQKDLIDFACERLPEMPNFWTVSERYREVLRLLGDWAMELPWVQGGLFGPNPSKFRREGLTRMEAKAARIGPRERVKGKAPEVSSQGSSNEHQELPGNLLRRDEVVRHIEDITLFQESIARRKLMKSGRERGVEATSLPIRRKVPEVDRALKATPDEFALVMAADGNSEDGTDSDDDLPHSGLLGLQHQSNAPHNFTLHMTAEEDSRQDHGFRYRRRRATNTLSQTNRVQVAAKALIDASRGFSEGQYSTLDHREQAGAALEENVRMRRLLLSGVPPSLLSSKILSRRILDHDKRWSAVLDTLPVPLEDLSGEQVDQLLFAEGELDSYLRSEHEREVVAQIMEAEDRWNVAPTSRPIGEDEDGHTDPMQGKRRRTNPQRTNVPPAVASATDGRGGVASTFSREGATSPGEGDEPDLEVIAYIVDSEPEDENIGT